MATFNEKYKGWEWTDEERQARQSKLRQAHRLLDKLTEQARRVGQHLPQFQPFADQAIKHLKGGLGEAARLDLSNRSRKYQPLSPEQLDTILDTLPELLKPWQQMCDSPAYAAAVRQKNKEIKAHNARAREINKVVAARDAAMMAKLDEALRLIDKGDMVGALDVAYKAGML